MRLPFFYGWIVVGVTFVTMGIGVNARTFFSLLFSPIIDEFGWPRGVTAGVGGSIEGDLTAPNAPAHWTGQSNFSDLDPA